MFGSQVTMKLKDGAVAESNRLSLRDCHSAICLSVWQGDSFPCLTPAVVGVRG